MSSILARKETWENLTTEPMLSPGAVDVVLPENGKSESLSIDAFAKVCENLTDEEADALKERMAWAVKLHSVDLDAKQPVTIAVVPSLDPSESERLRMLLLVLT